MHNLSDLRLIECFLEAKEFNLDQRFICLLYEEIKRRNINIHDDVCH
ncbi:sporulation histidine kinase inhibitor Sda [Chengkuizengella marina]|uniref:Sporulation histidine kinase inhibitor Sda n=1 Tax=Chengkuizengella marina TaxID=2507566 RepID=A0A6N9Q7N8_9BACL|nr:sporulation histidine kinase inhibitor Sda [Chengkuizengella marina]NBI30644.1 sporulation histidine kinase inhibitor Sda [Chengkuizengella marina]